MSISILFPEYMDFSKPCRTCGHFFKGMKQYDVASIIKHHHKESGTTLVYELGQKFCVKQKEFVYFNWNCNEYIKR